MPPALRRRSLHELVRNDLQRAAVCTQRRRGENDGGAVAWEPGAAHSHGGGHSRVADEHLLAGPHRSDRIATALDAGPSRRLRGDTVENDRG